jgi:hypothetical protein
MPSSGHRGSSRAPHHSHGRRSDIREPDGDSTIQGRSPPSGRCRYREPSPSKPHGRRSSPSKPHGQRSECGRSCSRKTTEVKQLLVRSEARTSGVGQIDIHLSFRHGYYSPWTNLDLLDGR